MAKPKAKTSEFPDRAPDFTVPLVKGRIAPAWAEKDHFVAGLILKDGTELSTKIPAALGKEQFLVLAPIELFNLLIVASVVIE